MSSGRRFHPANPMSKTAIGRKRTRYRARLRPESASEENLSEAAGHPFLSNLSQLVRVRPLRYARHRHFHLRHTTLESDVPTKAGVKSSNHEGSPTNLHRLFHKAFAAQSAVSRVSSVLPGLDRATRPCDKTIELRSTARSQSCSARTLRSRIRNRQSFQAGQVVRTSRLQGRAPYNDRAPRNPPPLPQSCARSGR